MARAIQRSTMPITKVSADGIDGKWTPIKYIELCKDQAEKGVQIDGYAMIFQPYMLSGQGHYIPPLVCRSWDTSHLTDSNQHAAAEGSENEGNQTDNGAHHR